MAKDIKENQDQKKSRVPRKNKIVHAEAMVQESQNLAPLFLKIERGPARGAVYATEKHKMIIGRKVDAAVPVLDLSVSREHAYVEIENGIPYVVDLKSRNGTLLNNKKVENKERLHAGDRIQLGDTLIRVSLEDAKKEQMTQKKSMESTISLDIHNLESGKNHDESTLKKLSQTFADFVDRNRNSTLTNLILQDAKELKKVRLVTFLICLGLVSAAIITSFM